MLVNQMIVVSGGEGLGATATTGADPPGIDEKELSEARDLGKRSRRPRPSSNGAPRNSLRMLGKVMDHRRFLLTSLASAAAPLQSRAQQPGKVARVGVLCFVACDIASFRKGLAQLG